jgi:Flp pilus assembly pilin Flp
MMVLIELSHNRARVFRIELGSRLLTAITIVLVAYLTFKTVFTTFAGFFSR